MDSAAHGHHLFKDNCHILAIPITTLPPSLGIKELSSSRKKIRTGREFPSFSTFPPWPSTHNHWGGGFRVIHRMQPMSVLSPADRAGRAFMRLGLIVASIAFVFVGSDVLLDQWIIGYASAQFILGTAALIAGICIGLFAIIAGLGLAVAAALRHKPAPPSPEEPPEAAPVLTPARTVG
jgi:hypothetical protein